MTRKSQMALPSLTSPLAKLAAAALGAAAIAAPVQAANITFDSGAGMLFGSGDTWQESGYNMRTEAYDPADVGSLVGMIADSSDPGFCVAMACPVNGDGGYYGALNDSIVWLSSASAGASFMMKSLDASFIGLDAALGGYPAISGILRMQGFLADGTYLLQDLLLDGPGSSGFEFGRYTPFETFANTAFVSVAMFGFTCNAAGNCSAFNSNRGQFAIDNLVLEDALAEVPEPATLALFGLGFAGLAARARRRQA
ncbi:PEP-CTERM sorting domain-containing protein [Massilia oculi]|uniref:PEP-CTERM sorting domain-containing protein n=2 Tax=Massilia oculi TaxID=945844 RepID=A0A2S2DF21_9BURK|nr:PEP-CTERM sorting domain-containing protein [Massilia oculi]